MYLLIHIFLNLIYNNHENVLNHCVLLINKIELPFLKISRFCRHVPTE